MYKYEDLKKEIFTESGQEMFLKIQYKSNRLLKEAGAFTMGKVISGVSEDSLKIFACVDWLVEMKKIREVTKGENIAQQHRVFVAY